MLALFNLSLCLASFVPIIEPIVYDQIGEVGEGNTKVLTLKGYSSACSTLRFMIETSPSHARLYQTSLDYRINSSFNPVGKPILLTPGMNIEVEDPNGRIVYIPHDKFFHRRNDEALEGSAHESFEFYYSAVCNDVKGAPAKYGFLSPSNKLITENFSRGYGEWIIVGNASRIVPILSSPTSTKQGHLLSCELEVLHNDMDLYKLWLNSSAPSGIERDWVQPEINASKFVGISALDNVLVLDLVSTDYMPSDTALWYFSASPSFIKRKSLFYGARIEFVLKFTDINSNHFLDLTHHPLNKAYILILECQSCNFNRGLLLGYIALPVFPASATRWSIQLVPENFERIKSLRKGPGQSGAPVSRCDFAAVLKGLTGLYILGDFSRDVEHVTLSDISIYSKSGEPIPRECYLGCRCPGGSKKLWDCCGATFY